MSNVYYKKVKSETSVKEIQKITVELLNTIISKENIKLEKEIPLKVHFGEKGNITYIKEDNFLGIIDFLKNKGIKTQYMETSSIYGGQRNKRELHIKTAKSVYNLYLEEQSLKLDKHNPHAQFHLLHIALLMLVLNSF